LGPVETVEATNFKFGGQIEHKEYMSKICKLRSKGTWRGHVTHLCNFGTPSISRERWS